MDLRLNGKIKLLDVAREEVDEVLNEVSSEQDLPALLVGIGKFPRSLPSVLSFLEVYVISLLLECGGLCEVVVVLDQHSSDAFGPEKSLDFLVVLVGELQDSRQTERCDYSAVEYVVSNVRFCAARDAAFEICDAFGGVQ